MNVELLLDRVSLITSSSDGSRRIVLEDISLTYRADERVGLIGRSGSGKTSLARLIGGLGSPTRGKVLFRPKRARAVMVLQRPEDHFIAQTVGQQIASYVLGKIDTTKILNLMTSVGLSSHLEGYSPLRLSGGQQRLVAIACSLAAEASVIVLDEPMAGLDSLSRQLVIHALRTLRCDQNLGFIIISHHPDDLLGLVDRLWILDEGKLIYDGSFDQAPISVLNKCLAVDDVSLYYLLRQLESQGVRVPKSIYRHSSSKKIAQLFQDA